MRPSPGVSGPFYYTDRFTLPKGMGDIFERERFKTDDKKSNIQ